MTDADDPPRSQRLLVGLRDGTTAETATELERLTAAETEPRKRALRALRDWTEERPESVSGLVDPLTTFLTDDERAVRLTTAKLFATLADEAPAVARPAIDPLADRLADEEEFYYVRARCAEALGYLALDYPDAVGEPERLAELRIGLEFDEPEVREKLAKALEYVALGDPGRLRHHVERLADHLDDDNELVRYHLVTTLVVVGAVYPERLAAAAEPLRERLDDPNPYVRGRTAETLGLRPHASTDRIRAAVSGLREGDEQFAVERAEFALAGDPTGEGTDGKSGPSLGTVDSVRATTERAVEAIRTPDSDGDCPHCGSSVPADGPPMCPRCGAPR